MSEIFKLRFQAELEGQETFDKFFSSGERGARSMQSAISSSLKDTARDIKSFVAGMSRDLMNASGLKLGIAGNAKQVLEFRDSLQRLVIMAQVGDDQIAGLKKQILDVAQVSNQAAPAVQEALSAFVEKTGDIETARKNLALYAQTATATAASLSDVAQVGVQLSDKLNVKDQAASFAILATQAKAGAIELKDLATYAPRIFSSGAALGLTGEKGVREAGALAQVYAKAFGGRGSGATTATAIERTFTDLASKSANVEALGIKVKGRDPLDVIFDIIKKTGGDPFAIEDTKIFDSRAMRGIRILANEYRATGKFGTYESFRDVQPNAGILASDAARAASTGEAALQRTQNSVFRSTDENLGDKADWLAKHSGLISGSYDFMTAHPLLAGAAGIAGLYGANLAKRTLFGGGLGGGGAVGKALGLGGGAVPVAVTNWPGGFGGGGGDGLAGTALKYGGGTLATLAAAAAIPAAGLALIAYVVHQQDEKVNAIISKYNAEHPVDPEAAKYFGTEYARRNKAVMRRGGIVVAEPGQDLGTLDDAGHLPVNEIKVEIHGDDVKVHDKRGTRSTKAQVKRHGGGN